MYVRALGSVSGCESIYGVCRSESFYKEFASPMEQMGNPKALAGVPRTEFIL